MADVTGPISTLPGAHHVTPDGTMCDEHPDQPAVARIQGETDSFGSEMHDLCAECVKAMRFEPDHLGTCDWCKVEDVKLSPRRDYEEGTHGPIYYVCRACIDRDNKFWEEQEAEFDDDWPEDWPDDDDYELEEASSSLQPPANGSGE